MSKRTVMSIFAIVLIFTVLKGHAGTGSDDRLFGLSDGQRINEDVQLVLKIPYEVVLYDEEPHIYLGVKNRSDEALKLIGSLHVAHAWHQLLYQSRSAPDGENLTNPEFIPDWDGVDNFIAEDFGHYDELNKGESVVYMRHRGGLEGNYDRLPPGTREIRIGLLTGPEEWAFSDWVPIRRLDDRRLEDAEIVYQFPYHSFTVAVRRMLIENDEYLFLEWCRLAKLPEGATPRFEFYREERTRRPVLKTYFDGVDVPPQLTDVGSILEMEWTPEIAQHATILEELRTEMRGGRETPDEDSRAQRRISENETSKDSLNDIQPAPEKAEDTATPAPPPQSSEAASPEPEAEPSPDSRIWPTLLVLLLIAGGTVLVIKHKRQS